MGAPDVAFPNLGIEFQNINRVAFTLPIANIDIMWYGLFITAGVVLGLFAALSNSKKVDIEKNFFLDLIIIAVPVSFLLTRMYYVVFNLHRYRDNIMGIFAFRAGGMGVFGGIIGAFLTLFLFSLYHSRNKKKKKGAPKGSAFNIMGRLGDMGVFGLLVGQIIGRLGNFVNREAFGGFTDNIFAMQLKLSDISHIYGHRDLEFLQSLAPDNIVGNVTYEMLQNAYYYQGIHEIVVRVHPTFLYEMLLNIGIFIFLWIFRNYKKFHGELIILYAVLYAAGRFFIENLRTDQLLLWNTSLPASMVVSCLMFVAAAALWLYFRIKKRSVSNA